MSSNKLKLISDKTELQIIASQFCPKPQLSSLHVCGDQISPSVSVRNVGVVFDSHVKFERQVSSIFKGSFLLYPQYISYAKVSELGEYQDFGRCVCHL